MTFNRILVHVDPDDQSGVAIKSALSIARQFDARLKGFFVSADLAMASAMGGDTMTSPQLVEEIQKHEEIRATKAKEIFDKSTKDASQIDGWLSIDATGVGNREAAATQARCADLIVVKRENEEDSAAGTNVFPRDLVVDTGRPLLLTPPTLGAGPIGDNIVVAWSNSREAVRAVFDSFPFLTGAGAVTIATVVKEDGTESDPGEGIADLLRDHGLSPHVASVPLQEGQKTSDALFDFTRQTGADLLVAGAYSHSRLREGLFGGVTRSIFEGTPVPTLLSH